MNTTEVEFSDPFPTNLLTRLSAAREDFPSMKKDQEGKANKSGRKYQYANRDQILGKIKEWMAKHELLLVQMPVTMEIATGPLPGICHMLVSLKDPGEYIKGTWFLSPDDFGCQGMGAALTYNSRYGLNIILGLEMEDLDAQQDQPQKPKDAISSPAELTSLIKAIDEQQGGYEGFLELWKALPKPSQDYISKSTKKLDEWKKKFPHPQPVK